MGEQIYSDALRNWLFNCGSEKIEKIQKVYRRSTLGDICRGKQHLESIPGGKRLRIFEITGIEAFKVEGEHHPKALDMSKVSAGQQPRSLIRTRMEYDGYTQKEIVKMLEVDKHTFGDYLDGKEMNSSTIQKIELGLSKIYSLVAVTDSSETDKIRLPSNPSYITPPEETGTPSASSQSSLPTKYAQLISELKTLRETVRAEFEKTQMNIAQTLPREMAMELIENERNPSLQQRIVLVNYHIESLANQMDYFRSASQEERGNLAKTIDPYLWGYVASLLPRIDQPNTYETVMRLMPKPERRK